MAKCSFCDGRLSADALQCPTCGAAVPQSQRESAPDSAEFLDRVWRLMEEGQKIEAIRVYRQATGFGLAKAKEAVEAIASGEPPLERSAPTGEWEQDVIAALTDGKKIEAIRLYRQQTGVGLREAKEAVEAIAVQRGVVPARSAGCFGALLLLAAAATTLWKLH